MAYDVQQASGFLINGFQAILFLGAWFALVILHGLFWRSLHRPEPDPVRAPGPSR